MFLTMKYGNTVYRYAWEQIGPAMTPFVVSGSVLGIGYGAFRFRQSSKELYGLVEILFGVVSAWSIVWRMKQMLLMFDRWAALAGCIYVVVRGFSNMREAERENLQAIREAEDTW
jgi:hypothetical protein